jgi:hypothetical protein|tara:strand:- start:407 stop:820 length:414 start_codon:yes stop_codon:yes gene_type:complete
MSEFYSDTLWDVGRTLFLAFIAFQAYKMTRDYGEKAGRWSALLKGIAWVAGIALFAAAMMGNPSCEESGDPLYGGCEQYADDGYEPTLEQRGARFLFWTLLLGIPAGFGLMDSRRYAANPWRRPEDLKNRNHDVTNR